jgi:hypothetical protein
MLKFALVIIVLAVGSYSLAMDLKSKFGIAYALNDAKIEEALK